MNWRELLAAFFRKHGCHLLPVRRRSPQQCVPEEVKCPNCEAPADYLYYNDGHKRSQLRCKVCGHLGQVSKRSRRSQKAKYWCPYCQKPLFLWKKCQLETIYKYDNDKCPAYLGALAKLNAQEKELRQQRSSQFKLRYQYREYHFTPQHLQHTAPTDSRIALENIHHSPNVLG